MRGRGAINRKDISRGITLRRIVSQAHLTDEVGPRRPADQRVVVPILNIAGGRRSISHGFGNRFGSKMRNDGIIPGIATFVTQNNQVTGHRRCGIRRLESVT